MKKVSVILVLALFCCISGRQVFAEEHIGLSYEDAMTRTKPFVMLIYVDWCGYCKRFLPVYKAVYPNYSSKFNFVMINGDDEKYKWIQKRVKLTGYPSVYIVDRQRNRTVTISRDYEDNGASFKADLSRY
jgi:thiol-disulfide isomerase/thioredoxin